MQRQEASIEGESSRSGELVAHQTKRAQVSEGLMVSPYLRLLQRRRKSNATTAEERGGHGTKWRFLLLAGAAGPRAPLPRWRGAYPKPSLCLKPTFSMIEFVRSTIFGDSVACDYALGCFCNLLFEPLSPKGPRGPKWVAAKTGHVITNCDLLWF
jgi:hypothetical protein